MTVVVVGGGPAGLAAALELRRRDTRDVVVVERESEAGGIPRHARHQGFGIRDLRRPLAGPAYARRYARRAAEAGVEIRTETMVTRWSPDGPLQVTGPDGPAADRGGRGDPRHRLPRAPPLGAARAGLAAGGCDEHRHAPAARLPEGAQAGRARADRRRGARELLGAAHARARGREGRRDDDRAATPPDGSALPRGRGAPLAHAALDAHAGRRRSTGARGWRRSS